MYANLLTKAVPYIQKARTMAESGFMTTAKGYLGRAPAEVVKEISLPCSSRGHSCSSYGRLAIIIVLSEIAMSTESWTVKCLSRTP